MDFKTLKNNKPKLLSIKDPSFKFEKYKKEQDIKIESDEKKQKEFLNMEHQKYSNLIRSLESNLHNSRKDMDLAQFEQWKKNMEIKKDFESRLHDELYSEANYFKNIVFESIKNSENEEKFQMENFEKNLSRLGLDMTNADQKLKKANSKSSYSSEIILQKIREKIQANATAKKERDRRKRKIQIEQKKAQEELLKNEKKINLEGTYNNEKTKDQLLSIESIAKQNEFKIWKELHNINYESEQQKQKDTEDMEREKNKNYDEIFLNYYMQRDKKVNFDKQAFIADVWKEDRTQKQKEMDIKFAQRNKNMMLVKNITQQLLDLVDEIHKFQNDKNFDLLDQNVWKEYMKNFTNSNLYLNTTGMKIPPSYYESPIVIRTEEYDNMSKLKLNETHEFDINANSQQLDGVFEECELFDYLNFIGQYKTETIIPKNMINKMLDIFEIMGNDLPIGAATGSKYGKITDAYKEYEPTDEDIENLTIPSSCGKNYNLSDIINILIDIKFTNVNSENKLNSASVSSNYNNTNYAGLNNKINNININNNLNITPHSGIYNINNNTNISTNKENIILSHSNADKDYMNSTSSNINALKSQIFNVFNNIPLKILFCGKKFSGRKTHIKYLTENFPLKFYNVEELITKNINLLEELEVPVEEHPKYKNLKKNELDKVIADRALEEQKFESLKHHVKQLKFYKDKGVKIPHQVLFEFLFEIIKIDFPEKTQPQIIEEINLKNKKKKELQEELTKLKEEKNVAKGAVPAKNPNMKNETFYINEIQKLSIESNKGFIIIDFPETLEQAKYFEKKITGYISEIEKPKNFISQIKENYNIILDKISKSDNQKNLIQGAFDLIFYLETSNEEILRRIKNRKIDPVTNIIYHMEDNPPPAEDKKLNERLIAYEENINYDLLNEKNNIFNKEVEGLIALYEVFGSQKNNFKSFNRFNSMLPQYPYSENNNKILQTDRIVKTPMKDYPIIHQKKDLKEQLLSINAEIKDIINHMVKINEEKENELISRASEMSGNIHSPHVNFAKETFSNISNNPNIYQNTNNLQLNTNLNLINMNPSRRNSISNISNTNTKDFQKTKDISSAQKDKDATSQINIPNGTQSHLHLNTETDEKNNHNTKNLSLKNSHQIQNLDEEDFSKYFRKLEEAKRKLANYTIDNIYGNWSKMYENYIIGVKTFFKNLRKQKETVILTYNKMQERFIEFLRRPSRKMLEINKFQKKYNKFFDEYPQLRGDEQVKEEFHQDIFDLSDRIWEAIEERKTDAIKERKKIMESGFIEKEMEKFYFYLEKLYSLEVEKFYTNANTIRDFYCNMDFKINTQESINLNPLEILKDSELLNLPIFNDGLNDSKTTGIDSPKINKDNLIKKSQKNNNINEISKENSNNCGKKNSSNLNNVNKKDNITKDKYPRLQKLFRNSFKLILKYDEIFKNIEKISKSNALNNLSSESSIRKMSRLHARRLQESTFVDDKREIYIYEEELKSSLKLEKNKFKYRVAFINFWAIDYLENLKKISKLIYDKLDDWIISTIKSENDAMNNLVNIFDGCIEKEMRLRIDFEMDSFDIYKMIDINDQIEIIVIKNISLLMINIFKIYRFFFKNIN